MWRGDTRVEFEVLELVSSEMRVEVREYGKRDWEVLEVPLKLET